MRKLTVIDEDILRLTHNLLFLFKSLILDFCCLLVKVFMICFYEVRSMSKISDFGQIVNQSVPYFCQLMRTRCKSNQKINWLDFKVILLRSDDIGLGLSI